MTHDKLTQTAAGALAQHVVEHILRKTLLGGETEFVVVKLCLDKARMLAVTLAVVGCRGAVGGMKIPTTILAF